MGVVENRVLRKIFRSMRDDVAGEWRRLHKEELYDLYSPPNFISLVKSRRKGAAHVACTGIDEVYTGLLWESLRERDHLENAGVDGTIKLNRILGWINLVQNRGKWLALTNVVMNLRVP